MPKEDDVLKSVSALEEGLRQFRERATNLKREVEKWSDGSAAQQKIWFARHQGAESFTPSMLPSLWAKNYCPYSQGVYREAWYHGLFSACCWYLLDEVTYMNRHMTLDYASLAADFIKAYPGKFKAVPGHSQIMQVTS